MAGHYKNETKCAKYNKGYDIRDHEKITPDALKAYAICGGLGHAIYQKIYPRKRQENERVARRLATRPVITPSL